MEWNEINYGMNNEAREHNGRDWAGAVSFFGLVIGRLQSGRQLAQRRDQPSSARHLFPFSSMKSIELWNWFHWIAELEWAERAGKEKKTTKERESAARLNSLWVGYELAAHLRGSTPQINFTYIQLICLASLAACSAKQRRAHAAHKWRKRGNPTLTLSSLWEWPAKNI